MPLEEAYMVLESGQYRTSSMSAIQARRLREASSMSAIQARRLREAHLVMVGQLAGDEIRAVLEAEFGPLD